MAGVPEAAIPVEETYREILRAAIQRVGGQYRAAALAGVNQATISRTIRPDTRVTYTTLRKLADALPGVPDPIVSVRDAEHERWCKIGAALAEEKPSEFRMLLSFAERELSDGVPRPTEEQIEHLKSIVADPVPVRLGRRRAR